ncbi:MAG: beta-propeller domain-containing protein [Lachnospiraceae bacterium]|nr:beta-propeller domain-containing protein [Lachnospiraceae bacterium]
MNKDNKFRDRTEYSDEEIMSQISKISDDIEIPDSLSPENMMRKIDTMKKENRLHSKEKGGFLGINKAFIWCSSLVVLLFAVYFGKMVLDGRAKRIDQSVNKVEYDSNVLMAGEGTNVVKSVSGRDEIKNAIVGAYMKNYFQSAKGSSKMLGTAKGDREMYETDDIMTNSESIYEGTNADGVSPEEERKSDDYYKNNDQVEGVVEADKVITDGKHIYAMKNNRHVIITDVDKENIEHIADIDFEADVNAYMEEKLKIKQWPTDEYGTYLYQPKFYVSGQNMIVIVNYVLYMYDDDMEFNGYNDAICASGGEVTLIIAYDLSDIHHPKQKDTHMVEGGAASSRLVKDDLYVVTSRQVSTYITNYEQMVTNLKRIDENCIPRIDGKEMECDHIYMVPDEVEEYCYEIVASFNISGDKVECIDSSAVLGDIADIYMSNQYIYTYASSYIENEYKESDGRTKEEFSCNTKLFKFGYHDGAIEVCAEGVINGYVLDQFSLDEYNGYLRVVATIDEWSYYEDYGYSEWGTFIEDDESKEYNALYILDENLNTCGTIEDIAEGERIYSARFSGDKAYFVTFKQTDPLFVADLSDINNPVITDELEMTGYSDYLQKWDDHTLLGVGVEANMDGVSKGLKLALYDISDENHLNEMTKYVFSDWYNYDNYDYKNMLVAPEKSLFGICACDENRDNHYLLFVIENNEIKMVQNYCVEDYDGTQNSDDFDNYYYDEDSYRAVYIGNYVYIITLDKGISAVSLEDYSVVNFVKYH